MDEPPTPPKPNGKVPTLGDMVRRHEGATSKPIVFRHIADIMAEKREPRWLLRKILEADVLAVLAGPRGTFKSFVGIDWALRVALAGIPVLVLSGEGAGLDRRVDAWLRTHAPHVNTADLPLYAIEHAINLRLPHELDALATAIEAAPFTPGLVLVDTYSKFSAGLDENDNGEVSAYLAGLTYWLRERFKCTVLLIAHSGHADPKRPRGASALMANPDAEYIVERSAPPGMLVTVTRERFKDSPSYEPLGYQAEVVDLQRFDQYGESVTSIALKTSDIAIVKQSVQPTGKAQRQLLAGLRNLQRDSKARLVWTQVDLRAIARGAGQNKATARSAVEMLCLSGFLVPSIGGYVLPIEEEGLKRVENVAYRTPEDAI